MTAWKLVGNAAQWSDPSIAFTFDQAKPDMGVGVHIPTLCTDGDLRLFGPCLPNEDDFQTPPQHFVCCEDSIHATLSQNDSFPVETQVIWRAGQTGSGHPCLDAVISVGTQLLSACSRLHLLSQVPASKILVPEGLAATASPVWKTLALASGGPLSVEASCALVRLPGETWSYAEMTHPSDPAECEVASCADTGRAALRHELFSGSLEKGVILRARLRGVFLPRESDCDAASAAFAEWTAAAPPLGR